MNTEPPTEDDLTRMLVSIKQNVMQHTSTTPQPKPEMNPWFRRHVGITFTVVTLLGLGGVTAALAVTFPTTFQFGVTSPSPTSTGTQVTPSPSVMPTAPSASPTAPAIVPEAEPWIIGVGQIGPLTAGMTLTQVADAVGVTDIEPWLANQFGAACSLFVVGTSGPEAQVTAGAFSQGGRGPVDFYSISDPSQSGEIFPHTEAGIRLGSTASDVEAAYGDRLSEVSFLYAERRLVLRTDDEALVFDINGGIVTTISTGVFESIAGFTECA